MAIATAPIAPHAPQVAAEPLAIARSIPRWGPPIWSARSLRGAVAAAGRRVGCPRRTLTRQEPLKEERSAMNEHASKIAEIEANTRAQGMDISSATKAS